MARAMKPGRFSRSGSARCDAQQWLCAVLAACTREAVMHVRGQGAERKEGWSLVATGVITARTVIVRRVFQAAFAKSGLIAVSEL